MRIIYFIAFHFLLLIVISCSTPKIKCPETPALGNMGDEINTYGNELSPTVYNDKLLFKTDGRDESGTEKFVLVNLDNNQNKSLTFLKDFNFKDFYNLSSPIIITNPITGEKEAYFSASNSNNSNSNPDLYKSVKKNDSWTNPEKISINTNYFETTPTISDDGKILIFSSDRPEGFGGMDLYKAELMENGTWSEPINLGPSINTQFNELTPYLDKDGNLWYSTNTAHRNNLDIVKCNLLDSGWTSPRLFLFPINTEDFDETSPVILNSKLIFASDRPNGCGEFDLYSFDICAPVQLEINIISDDLELPINGNINILENDSNEVYNKEVTENTNLIFDLKSQNHYTISYKNNCVSDNKFKYDIYTPCSDTNVIKLKLNIEIKGKEEFTFSKYNIPFFVSGYYQPNTTENLMALKMKFNYNLIGNNDTTRYIENPGQKYDEIAPIVDSAMNDAVDFIIEKLNLINSPCSKGYSSLEITVKGYADPRKLSTFAKYIGPEIIDDINKIFMKPGQNLDNQLLSELRAYFTAKSLVKLLKQRKISDENINKIRWVIKGLGSQEDNENYELLRRTDIEVKMLK